MPDEQPRILVVEDNVFIAMEVEMIISQSGCRPVGPVSNVEEGLAAARETALDGAVLDINLGDERVWPVADLLHDRGVPFVLATGYSADEVPERFSDRPVLHKPLRDGQLATALAELGLVGA